VTPNSRLKAGDGKEVRRVGWHQGWQRDQPSSGSSTGAEAVALSSEMSLSEDSRAEGTVLSITSPT
jgi:hypothetical protein